MSTRHPTPQQARAGEKSLIHGYATSIDTQPTLQQSQSLPSLIFLRKQAENVLYIQVSHRKGWSYHNAFHVRNSLISLSTWLSSGVLKPVSTKLHTHRLFTLLIRVAMQVPRFANGNRGINSTLTRTTRGPGYRIVKNIHFTKISLQ